jgi:isopenicillin-N epimerase
MEHCMFGLRRQFLFDPTVTFLNHGSFGSTPRPVFRVYQRWQRELERQPVEFLGRRFNSLMQAARQSLAGYLGTDVNNLEFTTNVTESLNIVARSLQLGPGDEVLGTDHEYGALDRTWRFMAREHGFTYLNQTIPVPLTTQDAFVDRLWEGVTPRTRVIFLSHITSPTGLIFPVEPIVRKVRQAGIITVVDGAHAPGQIPLRLDDLDPDYYGGNLHKWLCAPKGAGFLYARPDMQNLLKPLIVSWGFEAEIPGTSRFIDHHEWTGTRDIAAFLSVPTAIEFQHENNWERVRSACHDLLHDAQARICALTGLSPLSGKKWFRQMTTAPLPDDTDLAAMKNRLYDEFQIEVPLILWKGQKLIRISVQGYNTQRDLEKLTDALKKIMML